MKRGNRLRRAGLVLALLVLAAIVTGVAASATKTVVPNQLTGRWGENQLTGRWGEMVVGRRGKVNIHRDRWYHLEFLHVTANAGWGWLNISGMPSCSGTGTYGWYIHPHMDGGEYLLFKLVHDACKQRVHLLTTVDWGPHRS